MLPGALGSSIVRPFYNRLAGGGPIVRTAQGTAQATDLVFGIMSLTIAVNVPAGDTLVCGLVYDQNSITDAFIPTAAGLAPSASSGLAYAVADIVLWVLTFQASTGPYVGNLVFDFSTGTGFPANAAAVASSVSNLIPTAPEDVSSSNAPVLTNTTQQSNNTAATSQAKEFVYGIVSTRGRSADTVGVWQDGLAAGQATGTAGVGVAIKEGFAVVAAVGAQQARVTGATSRIYGATCMTYKGN